MGEVFAGRYELVDPIGRGGVGAVWRAWDHRRRRYVAAKVLQQRDAHSLLRFVREQALRIDHPHVLAPTSWAADDDQVLFTMELVTGGSLVNLVNDYGPLPPALVCTLLDQLLSGLAAVHAEDVVHRDVKPANILLEATGTARPHLRLSDFGIAMRLGEPRLTETNHVVGTPGYFAPEQMLGEEPDFPADLFAVGLVALYLLEGAKPDARALIEYFAARGTPGPPKGIPKPLWQVVATLLQPDPNARFRTATGARKALAYAAELFPEPSTDDELVEVFDQLGPLPAGFLPDGPLKRASGLGPGRPNPGATPSPTPGTGMRQAPSAPSAGSVPQRPSTAPPMPRSAPSQAGSDGGQREHGASHVSRSLTSGSVYPEAAPGAVRPEFTPFAVPPRPEHDPEPVRPSLIPDTGSFHLPPPQAQVTAAPVHAATHDVEQHTPRPSQHQPEQPFTPPTPTALPAQSLVYPLHPSKPTRVPCPRPVPPLSPLGPESLAHAQTTVQQHAHVSTGLYTAPPPQVPHRSRRVRQRRPGPPARVAVPVLLLSLACFTVGFWALAQL